MTRVKFKFDKGYDTYNLWATANSDSKWRDFSSMMPKKLVDEIKKKSLNKSKKTIELFFKHVYNSKTLKIFEKSINSAWSNIEHEFLKRLKNITRKQLKTKKITGYITLAPRCPYNFEQKWFMVNYFSSIPIALQTSAHELMHFHFYEHYKKQIERQIGKEKTQDLKEALTIILNIEFSDLWFVNDKGYEPHKDLREFIKKEWLKNKDFDILLNKCVDYLKIK